MWQENKKAVYCDMDGTLASCEHRRHHLETNNWPGFFGGMCDDTIISHTEEVLRALHAAGYAIIIGSARPDENNYRQMTTEWLDRHNIPYSAIYLRKGGDYRKDSIVKIELLEQMMEDGWDIQFALDDRDQVVKAFREYGLPVLQVNEGDFDNRQSKYVGRNQGREMLHMMVGPSGAGKSTYIKANYKPESVVSSDEIRKELFGSHDGAGVHDPNSLALTWSYVRGIVENRLKHGLFTVLDSTALRRKDRMSTLELVPQGYLVRYVIVDRDYDEKIRDRGWRPVELVDKHHKAFKSAIKDVLKADGQGNVTVVDTRPSNIRGR